MNPHQLYDLSRKLSRIAEDIAWDATRMRNYEQPGYGQVEEIVYRLRVLSDDLFATSNKL